MKIALLDVDGVVADFQKHAVDLLGLQVELSQLPYQMEDHPSVDKDLAHNLYNTPEFWLTLPLTKGAEGGIDALRVKGYEVIFLSAPWVSCPLWEYSRRKWLSKHFSSIPVDNFISCSGEWKKLVHGTFLLEDKPINAKAWQKATGGKAYLFKQPYNSGEKELRRVDWKELLLWV